MKKRTEGYLFVLPAVVYIVVLVAFPFIYSLYLSVHDIYLAKPWAPVNFVGLQNYIDVLNDPFFRVSLVHTLQFIPETLVPQLLLGILLAHILNMKIKRGNLFRTIILFPWVMVPSVIALNFRFMFNASFGIVNYLLSLIEIPGLDWYGGESTALHSLVMLDVWTSTPFFMIVILGAIRSLPVDIFDSSKIDGASSWQTLTRITLPLIRPAIVVALIMRLIFTINFFPGIWLITQGGPAQATYMVTYYLVLVNWIRFDLGHGAAMGWIINAMMMVFGFILVKIIYRR